MHEDAKEANYRFYRLQTLSWQGRINRGTSIVSLSWFAAFLSFFMLGLPGGPAALLPWVILAALRPQSALSRVIENLPLLFLPGFAFLSTAWSQFPETTLRLSTEFLFTTIIAIWAGSLITTRAFASALLCALTLIMTVCLIVDGRAMSGEAPLQGVFESKNQFAFFAVILLMAALTVVFDKRQHKVGHLLGLFALVMAPICLIRAESAGALVFSIPAIGTFLGLAALGRRSIMARAIVLAVVLIATAAALLAVNAFVDDFGSALDLLGKDSTLTGRAYLWQRAFEFIEQAPMLGVGYQAFWQVGNPPAEDLWAASLVESGAGFNFHNLYLHYTVELGYVGLLVLVLTILWMAGRLFRAVLLKPGYSVNFAVAVFVYFLCTSFVEVGFFYPFQLGTIIFSAIWIHSTVRPARSCRIGLEPARKVLESRESPVTRCL